MGLKWLRPPPSRHEGDGLKLKCFPGSFDIITEHQIAGIQACRLAAFQATIAGRRALPVEARP
jgi:hypothetical protein